MNSSLVLKGAGSSRSHLSNWYIYPGLFFYLLFLGIPIALICKESFWQNGITLAYYQRIFKDATYVRVLLNTIRISSLVTIGCFILSYPFSMLLVHYRGRGLLSKCLYVIFAIPLIVNPLALLYAWMVILQKEGVINFLLIQVGISAAPFQFIYNSTGVVIPMIYLLVPYSILLTYASIISIDDNLMKAALNLGANYLHVFRSVIFPLSLPGAISAAIIVFALAMGYFVTPALLGGIDETVLAMIIKDRMNMPHGWGVASALTIFLFFVVTVLFLLMIAFLRFNKTWERYFQIGYGEK